MPKGPFCQIRAQIYYVTVTLYWHDSTTEFSGNQKFMYNTYCVNNSQSTQCELIRACMFIGFYHMTSRLGVI